MAYKVRFKVGPSSAVLAVRIEPAIESESSDRFTVCTGQVEGTHPPSRTKQSNSCPVCQRTHSSAFGFTQRGIEVGDQIVVLSTEELEAASGTPRTGQKDTPPVELAFHSREKVYASTVAGDSVQNIFPQPGNEQLYLVVREALRLNPDLVVAMIWAPRTANALWVIEAVGDRLVASKRCWPEQVRAVPATPVVPYLDEEVDWMGNLMRTYTEDFDLSVYSDQAKVKVKDLVASRAGEDVASPVLSDAGIADLLGSLQRAVAAAKPAPAKKTAARKAPAKKAAAKKATTRKKVAA